MNRREVLPNAADTADPEALRLGTFPTDTVFLFVCNIPSSFRARDLRAHFSDLVEEEVFLAFHFRHRKEIADDNAGMLTLNHY